MKRNYKTPHVDASWADSRETCMAVATAIYAISDRDRSPEDIWEAPTAVELDHVTMAVQEYIAHGDFPENDDCHYPWGAEPLIVPPVRETFTS